MTLDLEPITPAVGAVASGIQLAGDLAPETIAAIRQAILKHGVVFFRDQEMSRVQMAAFMGNFGELCNDPFSVSADRPTPPEETIIDMVTSIFSRATEVWHYDSSLAERPASLMALRALQLPSLGGDTCWANMYAAYEALSAPLRGMLDALTAEHSAVKLLALAGEAGKGALQEAMRNVHPVIRVHPETGRKALFVNELWTERVVELEPLESAHLLAMLFEHIKTPVFTMRWRWRVNDFALWDNRAFQHYAVRDYGETRILQKSLIAGDRPYGPR
jgi:alpha-ketoglutarate-dependent taurine dioxygenase